MATKRSFHCDEYGTVTARMIIKEDEASEKLLLVRRHRALTEEYFHAELSKTADENIKKCRQRGRRRAVRPYVFTVTYRFADGTRPTLFIGVSLSFGAEKIYEKNEEHAYVKYRGELYYKGVKPCGKHKGNVKNVTRNG